KTAQATLGQPKTVEWRGVEEADTERPGALDCRFCIRVADRRKQPAKGSRSKADRRDVEPIRKARTLHSNVLPRSKSSTPSPASGRGRVAQERRGCERSYFNICATLSFVTR